MQDSLPPSPNCSVIVDNQYSRHVPSVLVQWRRGTLCRGAPAPNQGSSNHANEIYASMIWLRTAYRTNSLTECSSSFLMIFARWVSAVFTLIPNATATSLLLFP